MDPPFGNSLPGMNGSVTSDLFGPGSSLLNVDYDCNTLRQLQEERMKNAALQRQYDEEKNLRKELERELAEMKRYMFADMSSMWAMSNAPVAVEGPASSVLSPTVPSFSPTVAQGTSRFTPTKSSQIARSDIEIRSSIISESIDMLGDKDPLLGDCDMMRDIDVLTAKLFVSPEKTGLKRDTSRHSFGKDDTGNSAPDLSGFEISDGQQQSIGKPSGPSNAAENARKRAEVTPLNIGELEVR